MFAVPPLFARITPQRRASPDAVSDGPKTSAKKRKGGKPVPWARLFIATLGGYFATVIISAAITAILPISRGEATALSLLLSGLIYTGLFVYVFALPSWFRAFRNLTLLTIAAGLVLALAKGVLF